MRVILHVGGEQATGTLDLFYRVEQDDCFLDDLMI